MEKIEAEKDIPIIKQFASVTKIVNSKTLVVSEMSKNIVKKYENMLLYLSDLEYLIQEYEKREKFDKLTTKKFEYYFLDKIPEIRLISFCEAATNCLYSLSELLANLINKLSRGKYKASFNAIRKEIEKNVRNSDSDYEILGKVLGNLEWYKKIREIRTEVVHYSTLQITKMDDGVLSLMIKSYRKESEREEFNSEIIIPILDISEWIKKSLESFDKLIEFLIYNYLIKEFDLDFEMEIATGVDFTGKSFFRTQKMTIREYLKMSGIKL